MSKYVEAANWVSEQRQAKNIFQNFNKMFNLESFEDAYLVQDSLETVWAHKGDVIGYKLALTSKAMQNMFGVQFRVLAARRGRAESAGLPSPSPAGRRPEIHCIRRSAAFATNQRSDVVHDRQAPFSRERASYSSPCA